MINNDTTPPKNNYTEKKRERGLFKVTTGRLAKCMFFRLPAPRQQMKLIHIWANCCSNGAHQARARVRYLLQGQLTVELFWMTVQKMWINKREGQCFAYLVLLSPITLSSVILLQYIKQHYCNSSFIHLHSLVRATMRRTPARALPCVSLHWWFSAYKESYFNNFQQITLLCKKTVPINMETTHLFPTWGNNIQSSTARLQKRV